MYLVDGNSIRVSTIKIAMRTSFHERHRMLTPTANLDARQRNLGADGGRKWVDVPIFHTPAEELALFG